MSQPLVSQTSIITIGTRGHSFPICHVGHCGSQEMTIYYVIHTCTIIIITLALRIHGVLTKVYKSNNYLPSTINTKIMLGSSCVTQNIIRNTLVQVYYSPREDKHKLLNVMRLPNCSSLDSHKVIKIAPQSLRVLYKELWCLPPVRQLHKPRCLLSWSTRMLVSYMAQGSRTDDLHTQPSGNQQEVGCSLMCFIAAAAPLFFPLTEYQKTLS